MPVELKIILSAVIFAFGIVVGSFLNVCIYRIPRGETVVTTPSHCMSCGYSLKWYDLIPVASWLMLGGKCRKCKAKLSAQYPIIEAANGILWVLTFVFGGFCVKSILFCFAISALLVLSVIDARTMEIPLPCNVFIGLLGVAAVIADGAYVSHLLGLVGVAALLMLVYLLTGGRGIGGGDIKLMAATGLLLGFGCNFVAFLAGCLYASVIHIARMKLSGAKSMLALGPYLSAGVVTAMWFGEQVVEWYLGFLR